MAKILKTKSIYYNDCNLIAQPAHPELKSRKDIPVELNRIIVSPMDAVVGYTFAKEASNLGLTICLHRFCTIEKQLEIFSSTDPKNVFVSIGLDDDDRIEAFKDLTTNWLIDCANGYLSSIKNVIYKLITKTTVTNLMLGNIHTEEGVKMYKEFTGMGFNIIFRVGISGGSGCSTSDATGINRGQITEIIECSEAVDHFDNFFIVADGGIKNGNYAAKAFGAGANYVMAGGLFAKAKEAETHIIGDGTYWGGASTKQQERYGGKSKPSEGKIYKIDEDKIESLRGILYGENGLWPGLASAISYSGYRTLSDFIGNGVFEIKENSLAPRNNR